MRRKDDIPNSIKIFEVDDERFRNLSNAAKIFISSIILGKYLTYYFDNRFAYKNMYSLRNLFGRKTVNGVKIWVIDMVIKEVHDLIERQKYLPGVKPYGYKLKDEYENIIIKSGIIYDAKLCKRIKRAKARLNTDRVSEFVLKNHQEIRINADEALKWINDEKNLLKIIDENKKKRGDKRKKTEQTPNNIYNCYYCLIKCWEDEDFYAHYSRKINTGRLYSSFAGLPKHLIQFLQPKEELYSIDVKNSQPYLFSDLIVKYYKKVMKPKIREIAAFSFFPVFSFEYFNELNEQYKLNVKFKNKILNKYYCCTLLTENTKNRPNKKEIKNKYFVKYNGAYIPAGAYTYILTASDGKAYDYLMKKLKIEDKNVFKNYFFANGFFSRIIERRLKKELDESYPGITEVIYYFKRKNCLNYEEYCTERKKPHANFAIQLQRKESKVIIGKVMLILEKKNIYSIPKHDSIICKQKDIKYIENLIIKEFKKEIGIAPTVKTEKLETYNTTEQ